MFFFAILHMCIKGFGVIGLFIHQTKLFGWIMISVSERKCIEKSVEKAVKMADRIITI